MQAPVRHSVLKWSESCRDIDRAYSIFTDLGISTLAKSRIAEYRRLFHDFATAGHNPANLGARQTTRLLHAIVEVDQLVLIATAASAEPQAWLTRLEPLIAGAAFPLEAKHDSSARDYQYECFIAAVAQLAGFRIAFREPDVVISSDSLVVGIAAKRPRHTATMLKNCRRAARQIRESAIPGIVAIDVSTALFSDFCVNTNDPAGAVTIVTSRLWNFIENHSPSIRAECADLPVIGVLVTAYAPALVYHEDLPPTPYTTKVWSAIDIARTSLINRQWFASFATSAHAAAFRTREMDA